MATAAAESATKSDAVSGHVIKQELIVPNDKVCYVRDYQPHVENMFSVDIDYGFVSKDSSGPTEVCHRWIEVRGESKNCKDAKNYLKALTTPAESMTMTYPPEAHEMLMEPSTHCRLEKQSKSAILFIEGGEMKIQGCDMLSVTLAVSAVEDLLNKFGQVQTELELNIATPQRQSSIRLDQELRRLSSEDRFTVAVDDMSSMNDAVKRSLLSGMREEDDDTVRQQQQQLPVVSSLADDLHSMRMINDMPKSCNTNAGFIDLHSAPNSRSIPSQNQPPKNSSAPILNLVMQLNLDADSQPAEVPARSHSSSGLRKRAIDLGYSNEEIDEVFKKIGERCSTSELLQMLVDNRSKKPNPRVTLLPPESFLAKQPDVVDLTQSPGGSPHPRPDLLLSTPSRADRASIVDLDTPVIDLVSPDTARPPPREVIVNNQKTTPKSSNPQKGGKSATPNKHFEEYLALRRRDEDEERIEDVEELKKRSEQRQKLLKEAMNAQEDDKNNKQDADGDVDMDLAEDNRDNQPVAKISTDGRMDTLDMFSLPYHVVTKNNRKNHKTGEEDLPVPLSPPSDAAPKKKKNKRKQKAGHSPQVEQVMKARSPSPRQRKKTSRKTSPVSQEAEPEKVAAAVRFPPPAPKQLVRESRWGPPLTEQQRMDIPPPQPYNPMPPPGVNAQPPPPRNNLRYIVIDGSNMAMEHGNHKVFSCKGIKLVVEYFQKMGHKEITAFVPQWRQRKPTPQTPISDQQLLEEMKEAGHLVWTPARKLPGKNIVSYDDRWIVRLASDTNGIIVSNDHYKDLWEERPEWRDVIENRLLAGRFIGDIFMVADDPMGRHGPMIEEFLSKPSQDPQPGPQPGPPPRGPQHNGPRPGLMGQYRDPNLTWQQNQGWLGEGRGQEQVGQPQGHWQGWQGQGYRQNQPSRPPFVQQQHRPDNNKQQQHYHQQQNNPGQQQPPKKANHPQAAGTKPQRQRSKSLSVDLFKTLIEIFPDDKELVLRILTNHPSETDRNKLTEFVLQAMP